MKNGYNIGFDDDYVGRTKVYLVPQCDHMAHRRQIGFIDHDDNAFHCTESELMTLEIMESILYQWKEWEASREKSSI